MRQESESRAAAVTAADPGIAETSDPSKRSATQRKWQRVLKWLVDGGTLNRFEAARNLRDWCLNTTISQLEARGVTIQRRDETVPGAFGVVHCHRYWLDAQSLDRARELVGLPRTKP